ncbi:MAG: VOC family protein [Bacteroidetes bacterium]|nr:VOC family protein [Bacteroidota bacterium]
MKVKYAHTNLVAKDWVKLAQFYIDVFQCEMKLPERNLSGKWLDDVTALQGAHINGAHLILPGFGSDGGGPTLEIFQYAEIDPNESKSANKEGFAHIAFAVNDVDACAARIIQHGGGLVGDIVDVDIEGMGKIHFAYAHDPEGNIVEIQKWAT